MADSGCVLAGEPCQLGTLVVVLGNGLLGVSVVIVRTNLLTQSPEWMGLRVGFDWLMAIKICRCWQHSVTLHRGQG